MKMNLVIYATIGALALLAIYQIFDAGRDLGKTEAIAKIERENNRARQAAEGASASVSECYSRGDDWVWSIRRQKCQRVAGDSGK